MEGTSKMAERVVVLKKIGAVSVAKIYAVFGGIWGILVGAMVALGLGAGAAAMGLGGLGAAGAGIVGFFAMILVGVVIFFLAGLIVASLYNVIAGWIGGIEMTLDIQE